jgi:hypothetical protein
MKKNYENHTNFFNFLRIWVTKTFESCLKLTSRKNFNLLALLSVENEMLNKIYHGKLLNDFVSKNKM